MTTLSITPAQKSIPLKVRFHATLIRLHGDSPIPESGNQLIMALSYTQKTSDNSLITKYVRKPCFTPILVITHMTRVISNPCTTNSVVTSLRTVCIWTASFPLTGMLVCWGIRQTLLSKCAFSSMSDLVDLPVYYFDPTSLSSLLSHSKPRLRSFEFSETATRANIMTCASFFHWSVVDIPAATGRCYRSPGTMAKYRTLLGQVALHSLVWERLIVRIVGQTR